MASPEKQSQSHQPGPGFPEPTAQARAGALGSKRGLASELAELRALVGSFGYAEREALTGELERLRAEHATLSSELAELRIEVVQTRGDKILQEVGVYDYYHQLEDSVAYKVQIGSLREQIREMSKKDGLPLAAGVANVSSS